MNNVDLQHVIDVNMSIGCQYVNWMSICQLDVNMSIGCQYVSILDQENNGRALISQTVSLYQKITIPVIIETDKR